MPLDSKTIKSLEDVLSSLFAEYMEIAFKSLQERLDEGLRNISRTTMRYRDVWRDKEEYKRDEIVTHEGGVWLSLRDNASCRPGKSVDGEEPAWRLIVKRGERGLSPSLKIDIDGLLTAHYPDGAKADIGSIKELVRNLLIEHGAIPHGDR
jgi:hypothetical protein